MTRIHRQLAPEAPRGYQLDECGDWFSIIIPEATENKFLNPSAERGITGITADGLSTVAQSAVAQYFGSKSVAAVFGDTLTTHFAEQQTTLLSDNTACTLSAYIRAPAGLRLRAIFVEDGNFLNTTKFTGTGRWLRVSVSAKTGSGAAYHALRFSPAYVLSGKTTAQRTIYIDGWQAEEKPYPTTYCDGDMIGFVPTRNDFYWTGAPHASTSIRIAQSRAGGREMKFSQFFLRLFAVMGLGMAPSSHVSLPSGFQGGGTYQRSIYEQRQFSLLADMRGSQIQFQQCQASLIEALNHNRVSPAQPLLLRYQRADDYGTPLSEEAFIRCLPESGPGNSFDNLYQETLELRFKQDKLPLIESGSGGADLDYQDTLTGAAYVLQRVAATGQWRKLGAGITASTGVSSASIVQSADGVIYIADPVGATIWTWDGITMTAAYTTAGGGPYALAIGPDGTLYAGGDFTSIDGVLSGGIASLPVGGGWADAGTVAGAGVTSITILQDGSVVAGGGFTSINAVANTGLIARLVGGVWTAMGTGGTAGGGDQIYEMAVQPSTGYLYVAGIYSSMGGVAGADNISYWDGTAWGAMGGGAGNAVFSLDFAPSGLLYVGGGFVDIGTYAAVWDGFRWAPLGRNDLDGAVYAVRSDNLGNIHMGGAFTSAEGVTFPDRLCIWNGSAYVSEGIDLPNSAYIIGIHINKITNDLLITYNQTGDALVPGATTVTNGGSAESYPVIEFVGPGDVWEIRNITTNKTIYFKLTLLAGERARLTLDPSNVTFLLTTAGGGIRDISNTILPGSQEAEFSLLPGTNVITTFISGSTTAATEASLSFKRAYQALMPLIYR